jgi:3-phenylpropionate/cinnamic acid dioxygenase small subunit
MAKTRSDLSPYRAVEELLFRAAQLLDEGQIREWSGLFTATSEYEMLFESKELGGIDDYVMKLTRNELVKRMDLVPNYVLDTARRLHLVSNIRIEFQGNAASVRSKFVVYRTTETGRTSLYAVGRSEDQVIRSKGSWMFQKRRVVLDTRLLEVHSHLPLQ